MALTLQRIGVSGHNLLLNAPVGYCLVEAVFVQWSDDSSVRTVRHYQGEINPYTDGRFVWYEIEPQTRLSVGGRTSVDEKTKALAAALRAFFDALDQETKR